MWGSTIPCVYYGFFCDAFLQKVYWSMVSILATGCTIMTIRTGFRSPSFRAFRSAMYAGLGLSFIIPIIHSISIFGLQVQLWRMSLDWMLLMATLNLAGAVTYASRVRYPISFVYPPLVNPINLPQVPEKWYPKRHDIYGASHQILHFAVIFAGLAHMFGLLRAFDHLHSSRGICK